MTHKERLPDTAPVRAGEELNLDALEQELRARLDIDPAASMQVEQFPGGHSNLTYCIRFGDLELVLRRPPVGPVAPTAHDMPREYRLLAAIHPYFPLAPRPVLLIEDLTVTGVPFYLMERRNGLIIREHLPDWIAQRPELCRRVGETLVDTLVELHNVNIQESGLISLGRPVGFVKRQVEGWTRRWERARTAELPEMESLAGWLNEQLPEDSAHPTLIHNDFKLDNVMLDPEDPTRPVAVLDWEMSTVGDPLIDLGLLLCYWAESGDFKIHASALPRVTTGPGWLTRDEIVERYALRSGRAVDQIAWYHIFAIFKLAVVIQQIYFRYYSGQTSDPRFAHFDEHVTALARQAVDRRERNK
ncbi:MAG: phosphotransferase family protein [Acidobacteria bacterium]|nr:phosphotransferase family protein [Acidobacteriota bacterium]